MTAKLASTERPERLDAKHARSRGELEVSDLSLGAHCYGLVTHEASGNTVDGRLSPAAAVVVGTALANG